MLTVAMANELLDTDVLIEFLRNKPGAANYIAGLTFPSVSAITVAELYAGVRVGKEQIVLDNLVDKLYVIDINSDIAEIGGLYRRDYGKSHGVGLNDALIAATAEIWSKLLVTFNRKHFPMLANVVSPYQRQ